MAKNLSALINQIDHSLAELSRILIQAQRQKGRHAVIDHWSARDIAGHMATVEAECHLDRVRSIATGEKPHFDTYLNTGRDFSHLNLAEALQDWATTRQTLIEIVTALSPEQLSLTGTHVQFGTLTVLTVLAEMYNHDVEHIDELKHVLE